jgi:glycosyltransferase involved in cell wall biosynthesis
MTVALFASAYAPSLGGVEEIVRQLAHALQRQGVKVIVLTNRWPRNLPAHKELEGVPVYRLSLRVPEGSLKAVVNYYLLHRRTRSQLLRILRRHDVDLMHIHCVSANGWYGLWAAEQLKLPIIVTSHGERTMDADRIFEKSPLHNKFLRDLLDRANKITACSRHTLADLENYYGQPFGPRGQVILNGIALEDFEGEYSAPDTAVPYVFAIGRLVEQKGFDLLLRAFALTKSDMHELWIAGDGPARQSLEKLISQLHLENRVRLLGRVVRQRAVELFKGCDFFVLPSRQEPLGLVNLEAMAAGKAVVAFRVGGVPEVVPDEAGVLLPPEDVPALAAAIERLANDSALSSRMGSYGRQHVKQFGWEHVGKKYLEMYHEVLSRP